MAEHIDQKEESLLLRRTKSFSHAGRGLSLFLRTTHNAWIQLGICACAVVAGFYFGITLQEWMVLILASGFVLAAEAFNTAIEIDVNLTSPDYHPYARDIKDVAAAAVLISAITAFVLGLLIFVPYILS